MKKESRERYLNLTKEKLTEAKNRLDVLNQDRNSSPHSAESQHDLIKADIERKIMAQEVVARGLEEFKEFLENTGEKTQIEEGAEFTVEFTSTGDRIENAIFAPLAVALEDVMIITPKSPLGGAVQGKKTGEDFVYEIEGRKTSGIVQRVE